MDAKRDLDRSPEVSFSTLSLFVARLMLALRRVVNWRRRRLFLVVLPCFPVFCLSKSPTFEVGLFCFLARFVKKFSVF